MPDFCPNIFGGITYTSRHRALLRRFMLMRLSIEDKVQLRSFL